MRPHRDAPPPSPIAPADELVAQPAEVAVVDGGTLKLGDRVVRLFGVEPPARGTPCGTRDDAGQDCAAAAANALAAMLRDLPVSCRITGMDGLGRPYAVCRANGTELNSAVIAAGWARADNEQPGTQERGTGSAGCTPRRLGVRVTRTGRNLAAKCQGAAKQDVPREPCAQRRIPMQAQVSGGTKGLTIFRLIVAIALHHNAFLPTSTCRQGCRTLALHQRQGGCYGHYIRNQEAQRQGP